MSNISKFTIYGELTDFAAYLKAARRSPHAENEIKQDETNRVAQEIMVQKPEKPTNYPVHITYIWYSKDARKDIDNVAFAKKFINDGIERAGILPRDSRKYIGGFTEQFLIDKENPRVEVSMI